MNVEREVRSAYLGYSDLRDESNRRGMSIVIELKRGTQPHETLNRLFAGGTVLCLPVADIPRMGRTTRGTKVLMRFAGKDGRCRSRKQEG